MKKWDFVLIVIMVMLSLSSLFLLRPPKEMLENKRIVIEVNGEVEKEIMVDKSTIGTFEFAFSDNKGYVEVKDGRVRMLKMDRELCRQEICSQTGWIQYQYETIACLPNKISLTIYDTVNKNDDVDVVSF